MAKYRTGEHFSFSFTLSESGIWIDPRILSPRDYHLFMQKDHLTSVLFSSLGLSDPLLESLEDAGFIHCTPIQAATLPLALQGQDIADRKSVV